MKKLIFFCGLILYQFHLLAQTNIYHPFPKDSALWENVNISYGYPNFSYTYSTDIWLGDTIINTIHYTKHYFLNKSTGKLFYIEGIRQDILNEKVYSIKGGTETDI